METFSYTCMTNVDIGKFAAAAMIVDLRCQSIPWNAITREANTVGNVVYRTHLAVSAAMLVISAFRRILQVRACDTLEGVKERVCTAAS